MSEQIKHECGIALIRLLKPLEYYQKKYGTVLYGLNKMYLLMEKQHNRGQDGAGVACIKFDVESGSEYINRLRSNSSSPIKDIFDEIYSNFEQLNNKSPELLSDAKWLKKNIPFIAELYLGHLRYGTFGKNSKKDCHPLLRQNNWLTRNLVIAGNFNLTNVDELFDILVQKGQHPFEKSDTTTILEKIGHFLDKEVEKTFRKFKEKGLDNIAITNKISEELDILNILKGSCKKWDGGYVIAGLFGHGDAFVIRDPSGIRPAFYYNDDEVVVVTSERPAIQTAFNVHFKNVKELSPGNALIIKKDGRVIKQIFKEPTERKACSFERIYFSRGTDAQIYQERKMLGKLLSKYVLNAVNNDLENTVFSFIPNTAEVAFYGLIEGVEDFCNEIKKEEIFKAGNNLTKSKLHELLKIHPRVEKIAVKDVKLRTFITQDNQREDLAAHVYDVTYGIVRDHIDTLVVMDDSIVRGTTLKQSIIRILDRLNPKKIIVVSSAPQIRYPDCYGIDMAKLGDFVAFQAAIMLLKEREQEKIIDEVYKKAKAQEKLPKEKIKNVVKQIYEPFSSKEISQKITEIVKPENLKAELQIIYQSIDNLHLASPNNQGDWYFTGEYPTPGGNKVANRSFINYIEGRNERAY
ncbi:MAG: amidophosphoribosyltransferase [Bacteroidales bacterium]|jgi:amidophosphoribosyltransferase